MSFHPALYEVAPVTTPERWRLLTRKNITDVLRMDVDEAMEFFAKEPAISRTLGMLHKVGRYLRLGLPATELCGDEAQRIKLATELQ